MLADPIRGAGSNGSSPIKGRVPPDIRSSRWLGPPPLPEEIGHWRQTEMVVSKLQQPRPSDSGSPKLGLCELAAPVKRDQRLAPQRSRVDPGQRVSRRAVVSGPRPDHDTDHNRLPRRLHFTSCNHGTAFTIVGSQCASFGRLRNVLASVDHRNLTSYVPVNISVQPLGHSQQGSSFPRRLPNLRTFVRRQRGSPTANPDS